MQEVDAGLFTGYLQPHLQLHGEGWRCGDSTSGFLLLLRGPPAGFAGYFTNKQGKVKEGSAIFWRRSRFRLCLTHDVLLRDIFQLVSLRSCMHMVVRLAKRDAR